MGLKDWAIQSPAEAKFRSRVSELSRPRVQAFDPGWVEGFFVTRETRERMNAITREHRKEARWPKAA
jgi:hypothetical protein